MDWGSITGLAADTFDGGMMPTTDWQSALASAGFMPAMIGFFVAFAVLAIIIGIALYVYSSWAWMTIAKKLGYKNSWLAWIPFANIAMILQLGGFAWGWVFLIFIPVLGWIALAVLGIIATWRIYEKRKYPGALSLLMLGAAIPYIGGIFGLANLIVIGIVAWNDKK